MDTPSSRERLPTAKYMEYQVAKWRAFACAYKRADKFSRAQRHDQGRLPRASKSSARWTMNEPFYGWQINLKN